MGLDMYLYSTEKFEDIQWVNDNPDPENCHDNGFLRNCILKTQNREIRFPNYYINNIKLKNNLFTEVSEIVDISKDTITFRYWNSSNKKYANCEIAKSEIEDITFTLVYWRKANEIHAWFVRTVQNNVDDCGEYKVTGKQLKDLKKLCNAVLTKKSSNFASANLPTQAGFFFGSTGYDDEYYEDLKRTVKQLTNIKVNGEYYYRSSW